MVIALIVIATLVVLAGVVFCVRWAIVGARWERRQLAAVRFIPENWTAPDGMPAVVVRVGGPFPGCEADQYADWGLLLPDDGGWRYTAAPPARWDDVEFDTRRILRWRHVEGRKWWPTLEQAGPAVARSLVTTLALEEYIGVRLGHQYPGAPSERRARAHLIWCGGSMRDPALAEPLQQIGPEWTAVKKGDTP